MMPNKNDFPFILPESPLYFCGNRTYIQGYLQVKYAYMCFANIYGYSVLNKIKLRRFNQKKQTSSEVALVPGDYMVSEQRLRALVEIEVNGMNDDYILIATDDIPPRREPMPILHENYVDTYRACSAEIKVCSDFWILLNESIQMLKKYHIHHYTKSEKNLHFWIGGIDDLLYFIPDPGILYTIDCKIKPVYVRKGNIYNYCQVEIKGGGSNSHYRIPFIGEPI